MLPKLNYKWRLWLHGAVAAIVNSAANTVTAAFVDPATFNPAAGGDWGKIAALLVSSSVLGFFIYIKTHPFPDPEKDNDAKIVAEKAIAKFESVASGADDWAGSRTGDGGTPRI